MPRDLLFFPNPFNPTTEIPFVIPAEEVVSLKAHYLAGGEIASLVNSRMTPGTYSVSFEAAKLTSGLYIYRLQADEAVQINKMILTK